MTTLSPNLLDLAKQGDPTAIAALLNLSLQTKAIQASVISYHHLLDIKLEATQPPDPVVLTRFIQRGLAMLDIQSIDKIRLNGYGTGQTTPAWVREFKLKSETEPLTFSHTDPHDLTRSTPENTISHQRSNPLVAQPLGHPGVKPSVKQLIRPRSNRKQSPLYPNAKLLWAGVIVLFIAPLALFVDRFIFSAATQQGTTEFVLGGSANAIGTTSTQAIAAQTTASTDPGVATATLTSATVESSKPNTANASSPPTHSAVTDSFRAAVNQATLAAELTQTARTQAEWQNIVQLWHEAAFLMSQVSWEHPQYDIAQQRVQQYQNNRAYAEQQLY